MSLNEMRAAFSPDLESIVKPYTVQLFNHVGKK